MNFKKTIKRLLRKEPEKVKIGKQYVGVGEPTFVIAEVGINHNGEVELAKQLIDAAVEAGADAVKFQKRTIEELLTKEGLERPYDSPNAFAPTYGEHRKKLEFSEDEYKELLDYTEEKGILFFASVWDHGSTDFMNRLGVHAYKIPSADVINYPLLEYVAQKNKPVLISTGMSTLEEVEGAVRTIAPHNNRIIIFHCISLYPAPEDKIDLYVMDVLKRRFRPHPVGYSGHESDLLPTLAAVARGAHIIERHLTLDKTMKGSDHSGSLEPDEFKELVYSIRRIENILGKKRKIIYEELEPLRTKLAKSIVAKVDIPKGAKISKDMLTAKSPGDGIPPYKIKELIGKRAKADIAADSPLPEESLEW